MSKEEIQSTIKELQSTTDSNLSKRGLLQTIKSCAGLVTKPDSKSHLENIHSQLNGFEGSNFGKFKSDLIEILMASLQ